MHDEIQFKRKNPDAKNILKLLSALFTIIPLFYKKNNSGGKTLSCPKLLLVNF